MSKKIWLGSGPAKLPDEVLSEAAKSVIEYGNTGISILELGHRSKEFIAILDEANALVHELCGLTDEYEVIWLQGGGRLQFSMVPMNFLGENETAGYIDSGFWAHDAAESAKLYGNVSLLSSSKDINYTSLPGWPEVKEDLAYLHITTNNTIYGTQWKEIPEVSLPLIADMSSDILGVPRNYNQFDLFYAVAQKNLGPAGVTLVCIKKELLAGSKRVLPAALDYQKNAAAHSLLNTAPVFAIYVCLLNLRWLKKKGIENQLLENERKANKLYSALENHPYFTLVVTPESRSRMNVVFRATSSEIEKQFSEFCKAHQIDGIDGHRSVGGFRAALYNAITEEDVDQLISIIKNFQPTND